MFTTISTQAQAQWDAPLRLSRNIADCRGVTLLAFTDLQICWQHQAFHTQPLWFFNLSFYSHSIWGYSDDGLSNGCPQVLHAAVPANVHQCKTAVHNILICLLIHRAYSSVVERSTADRQVSSSNLDAPLLLQTIFCPDMQLWEFFLAKLASSSVEVRHSQRLRVSLPHRRFCFSYISLNLVVNISVFLAIKLFIRCNLYRWKIVKSTGE